MKKNIKKFFLNILLKANFQAQEIEQFTRMEGFPTLVLKDGTRLSVFGSRGLPQMDHLNIPEGFQEAVHAYVTRYKYPHFAPDREMKSGIIPIDWLSFLVHPQHKNTLQGLPSKDAELLRKILSLKKGDIVLEIGSFIGFGTVQMSRLVGESGKVVAVEADDSAFKVLKLNVRQNNISNVTVKNYAIGEEDKDEAFFWKQRMQANSLLPMKGAEKVSVKMRKISTVIEETGIYPNFMILTINGYELKALESCRIFLHKTPELRIITPGWYKDDGGLIGPRIIRLLESLKFKVFHTRGMHIFAFKSR